LESSILIAASCKKIVGLSLAAWTKEGNTKDGRVGEERQCQLYSPGAIAGVAGSSSGLIAAKIGI
jgi:hypothetical protein